MPRHRRLFHARPFAAPLWIALAAATLAWGALPATALHEGRAAAERIAAVIACTAFDAGTDRPAFVAEFSLGVAQLEPGESAASALERAAAKALHPAET